MNPKATAGAALAFMVVAYLANVYFYLPTAAANPAPGTALIPLWASLLVTAVVNVVFLDWVNRFVKHAVKAALILGIAQILLVDVYYVMNGTRSLMAGAASAVTLLLVWGAGGFVYGKLSNA